MSLHAGESKHSDHLVVSTVSVFASDCSWSSVMSRSSSVGHYPLGGVNSSPFSLVYSSLHKGPPHPFTSFCFCGTECGPLRVTGGKSHSLRVKLCMAACVQWHKRTQIFTHTHTQINRSVGQGRQPHYKLWGGQECTGKAIQPWIYLLARWSVLTSPPAKQNRWFWKEFSRHYATFYYELWEVENRLVLGPLFIFIISR